MDTVQMHTIGTTCLTKGKLINNSHYKTHKTVSTVNLLIWVFIRSGYRFSQTGEATK